MREEADGTKIWAGEFLLDPKSKWQQGELCYHAAHGIELRLQTIGQAEIRPVKQEYELIHARLEGAYDASLVNCFDAYIKRNLFGYQYHRIHVNFAIIGVKLPGLSTPAFSEMHFQSPLLTRWYDPGREVEQSYRRGRQVSFTYKPSSSIRTRLDELRTALIWSGPSYRLGLNADGTLEFSVTPGIRIRYRKLQNWLDFLRDVRWLELFFCPAAARFEGPSKIQCRLGKSRRASEQEPLPELLLSLNWYQSGINDTFSESLFTLQDVESQVGSVLGAWFRHHDDLLSIIGLHRLAVQEDTDTRNSFLFLAQAAEALHRKAVGGSLLDPTLFETVRQALEAAVPGNLPCRARKTLIDRFKYMNELSLGRRYRELMKKLPVAVQKGVFGQNRNKDIQSIVDYRNFFTHVNEPGKSTDLWVHEVDYLTSFLRCLLEASLLSQLGVSEKTLTDISTRNLRFAMLHRHRAAIFGARSR